MYTLQARDGVITLGLCGTSGGERKMLRNSSLSGSNMSDEFGDLPEQLCNTHTATCEAPPGRAAGGEFDDSGGEHQSEQQPTDQPEGHRVVLPARSPPPQRRHRGDEHTEEPRLQEKRVPGCSRREWERRRRGGRMSKVERVLGPRD
jgi:hypothetical protein